MKDTDLLRKIESELIVTILETPKTIGGQSVGIYRPPKVHITHEDFDELEVIYTDRRSVLKSTQKAKELYMELVYKLLHNNK